MKYINVANTAKDENISSNKIYKNTRQYSAMELIWWLKIDWRFKLRSKQYWQAHQKNHALHSTRNSKHPYEQKTKLSFPIKFWATMIVDEPLVYKFVYVYRINSSRSAEVVKCNFGIIWHCIYIVLADSHEIWCNAPKCCGSVTIPPIGGHVVCWCNDHFVTRARFATYWLSTIPNVIIILCTALGKRG